MIDANRYLIQTDIGNDGSLFLVKHVLTPQMKNAASRYGKVSYETEILLILSQFVMKDVTFQLRCLSSAQRSRCNLSEVTPRKPASRMNNVGTLSPRSSPLPNNSQQLQEQMSDNNERTFVRWEINVKSDMRTTLRLLEPPKFSGTEHIPFPGAWLTFLV